MLSLILKLALHQFLMGLSDVFGRKVAQTTFEKLTIWNERRKSEKKQKELESLEYDSLFAV